MFATGRAESLLEWKVITDQDAERYLLQTFLKKERWKGAGVETPGKAEETDDRQGEFHTTKFTQYTTAEEGEAELGVLQDLSTEDNEKSRQQPIEKVPKKGDQGKK